MQQLPLCFGFTQRDKYWLWCRSKWWVSAPLRGRSCPGLGFNHLVDFSYHLWWDAVLCMNNMVCRVKRLQLIRDVLEIWGSSLHNDRTQYYDLRKKDKLWFLFLKKNTQVTNPESVSTLWHDVSPRFFINLPVKWSLKHTRVIRNNLKWQISSSGRKYWDCTLIFF